VLCRLALRDGAIDPWSFTAIRLSSGALLLAPLLLRRGAGAAEPWRATGGIALLVYALCFSLAYVLLSAATGALLLFGCVQLTMLGAGFAGGERPSALGFVGITAAICGVSTLVMPGVTTPNLVGASLMAIAGVAWGAYSLLGRRAQRPLRATAQNFIIACAISALIMCCAVDDASLSSAGVLLAVASGTITSAVGYVLWYAALPAMTATQASVAQLAVPIIATAGGVALLGERPDGRLIIASALTLGGIALTLTDRARSQR